MMSYVRVLIPLWLFYVLLTNNWQLSNMIVGVVVAGWVAWLLRPSERKIAWHTIPGALEAAVYYVGILLVDLAKSGWQVARIILFNQPVNPGIIAIPSGCNSELGTALSAHAITVTPGEMVVEINEAGVMYTHCLEVDKAAQYMERAQKMRAELLQRIFI